jgi:peptide/nickel transport system substrate-binding protein
VAYDVPIGLPPTNAMVRGGSEEERMVSKRFGALIAVLGLIFAACSSGAATSTPTPAAATSAPAGATATPAPSASTALTPKAGGTLVVALPGDMAFADPALISDGNSAYVMAQVVEGLVGLKPGTVSDVIPVLASALPTVSADGKTYTFTLRTGVKFHDGTDFNGDAVVFNYNRWAAFTAGDLQTNAYYYGAVFNGFGTASNIASVTAPNATTVVFTLKVPQSNFLISQTIQPFGIQSPTALKNDKADTTPLANNKYAQGQGQSMVGTGPFMFKEWVPKDHITLTKNPNYWNPTGVAYLDSIVFKPIADETSVLQSLQSGGIDLAQVVAPSDVATISANSSLAIINRGESCNIGQISMNQDGTVAGADDPAGHTLLANKSIRLAIASAVNKAGYISAFYAGTAKPAESWMPPSTQYYKSENLPTYDVAKAKSLIAASGVPASQLAIDFYYPSNVARPYMPDPKGLAEAIAQDLTAIGFTVTLKTEDWGTGYLTDESAGKFPMWLLGWTCDWAGADNFLDTAFFHYVGGKPSTEFAYKNDQLNTVMNQALAATDPTQIGTLWQQAQDLIAADMPTVPLVNSAPPGAMASYVEGFIGAGNLTENFNSVWLNK